MKPKISIIVPNYNHEKYIEQRLFSIFNQTYQDFEVILLDDASTDKSPEILKSYEHHEKVQSLIINDSNSGSPFLQWQRGIQLSKGDLIWIAESDDYCELNFLEILVNQKSKNTNLIYSQSTDVNELNEVIYHRKEYTNNFEPNIWLNDFKIKAPGFTVKYLLHKNVIPNASAVLFEKSYLENEIFSDELLNMKMCGDWLFWLKYCSKANVQFVSRELNYFRNHENITRIHKTLEQKKERLLEEAILRKYMKEKYGFFNTTATKNLNKQWFLIHNKSLIINKSFYKIAHSLPMKIYILFKFLIFKIKNV